MPKTFTNEPMGNNFRHECRTERGSYVMGKSWIDTTSPSDMMDYDFTQSFSEAVAAANRAHADWCRMQAAHG